MKDFDANIGNRFRRVCKSNPDESEAISAIYVLTSVLRESDVSTVQGLHDILNNAITHMSDTGDTYLSVKSACELFQRFITLTIAEAPDDFNRCKQVLQERADLFMNKVSGCRRRIADNFLTLIRNNVYTLLIHSYSRVVLTALTAYAKEQNDRTNPASHTTTLQCYVTTCAPHESGRRMMKELARLKIPCTIIPDLAIAYLMPKVNCVVMGAQAVVESGGILNDLGSSTVAMIASQFGKPVYVLAESFKFIRAFPLDQQHMAKEFKGTSGLSPPCSPLRNLTLSMGNGPEETCSENNSDDEDSNEFPELNSAWAQLGRYRTPVIERTMPSIDYTKPHYISYLITDLGILTPSVVSDELIKLYL